MAVPKETIYETRWLSSESSGIGEILEFFSSERNLIGYELINYMGVRILGTHTLHRRVPEKREILLSSTATTARQHYCISIDYEAATMGSIAIARHGLVFFMMT